MSLTKADLVALENHVQRACPGLPADRREDLVQEAVATALEQGPPDPESALLDRAKAAVATLHNSERNRQRRGGRIQHDEGSGAPLTPVRRTNKRQPHVPKGLMRVVDDTALRLVPLGQADLPDATTIAAARRLFLEVVEPAMAAHPISMDAVRSIKTAYVLAFDEAPELVWASILKEELQRAHRGLLEAELASACDPLPNPGTFDWSIDATKTAAGEQAFPDLPRNARLQLKPVCAYGRRGKVTVQVEAQYKGKLVIRGFVDGTLGEIPPAVLGTTPTEHAAGVLLRALLRVAELGCGPLPEYVMNLELIALLIRRAGFGGGGGAGGRLSGPSLLRLLADPRKLADEVEAFGRRQAERLPDNEADSAEARYREIANGIREGERCRRDCRRTSGLPGQG